MAPRKKRVKKDPHLQNANSDSEMEKVKKYNPIELYQYSLDSKENQEIAKSIGKEKPPSKLDIHFDEDIGVLLKFSKEDKDQWWFMVDILGEDGEMTYNEKDRTLTINVEEEDVIERGLKMIEELMNLFGCTLQFMKFYGEIMYGSKINNGMSDEDLLRVIQWINKSEITNIPKILVETRRGTFSSTFVKNFEKPVKKLIVFGDMDPINFPRGSKCNQKLVVDEVWFGCGPINLNIFISINCETLDLRNKTTMTNKDVNVFLRSWQNGESHTRLKADERELRIRTSEFLKLKKILKGLSPVIRDPRTTKRFFLYGGHPEWLHGGVDIIRRTDGQFLTIQCLHHTSADKYEEVPEDVIDDFEKYKNWDWNDETEDVELDNYDDNNGLLIFNIW